MKLELIEWYDHWGRTSGGWMTLEEIPDPVPSVMKTVGWVIKETKDCVLVSPDIDQGLADGHVKSNHEQCILKKVIKSRKRLAEGGKRKKLKE